MSKLQRWSVGIDLVEKGFYQSHDDNGHWVEYDKAAKLIEQLQQRNAELQMQLNKKSEVGNQLKDSLANSFEREQYLKQERDELAATVERLSGVIAKFERSYEEIEYDGKVGVFFESDALDELSEALESTTQQSLNALKRDCLLILARDLSSTGEIESNVIECIEVYANTNYPTEDE